MGTKVQYKGYLPGYYSMRDLNEVSNSCSWPLYYADKPLLNGQYYNGFLPRSTADAYMGDDKDAVKRTMLEHEATFKNQVYELHRLYKIQRDLMDEIKRTELHRNQIPQEVSFSSNTLASQVTSEDPRKWRFPPVADSSTSLNSMKGNHRQAGPFISQNGRSSRDFELLESRATKLRRKMFDLQLPAHEYIDSEEDETVPGMSCYVLSQKEKNEPKRVMNEHGSEDVLRSGSCLWNKNGLADLNEPVQVEEIDDSAQVNLDGQKSQLQGISMEILLNSSGGSDNAIRNINSFENNGNGRGMFLNMLEAGHTKGSKKFVSQSIQTKELPLSSSQVSLRKFDEPPSFYLTDKEQLRGSVCSLQFNERSHAISVNNHHGPFTVSHISSSYPICHSISSSEKPTDNLYHKQISIQMQPCLDSSSSLHNISHASAQSNWVFGDSWNISSNSRPNPGFGSDVPYRNGFCLGSSSGSKEKVIHSSSISNKFQKCSKDNTRASEHIIDHDPTKFYKGYNNKEMNFTKDHCTMLPWLKSTPSHKNESVDSRRFSKSGDLSFVHSSLSRLPVKNEMENGNNNIFSQNIKSGSCSNDVHRKFEGESSSRKLLGFPIFEETRICKNESFSITYPAVPRHHPSEVEVEDKMKIRVLDINLPCEDPLVVDSERPIAAEASFTEKEKDPRVSGVRHYIDLNSCVSDDEASPNITVEIDLEVPAFPYTEEDIPGEESREVKLELPLQSPRQNEVILNLKDELMNVAAEAIVAISSSGHYIHLDNESDNSSPNPLNWFVDIVFSCVDNLERKFDNNEEPTSEAFDYFELMTLRLTEIKEEDYMPKPLVPESIKIEETGTSLVQNRTRRGQGRRGRQRRDFQRDILPGLSSLSRHEVTEDLQMFGGLMRATGCCWQGSMTRRNSTRNRCARGRGRSVIGPASIVNVTADCSPVTQQRGNIEMGLEDGSLTGWGKRTRRPRRQRCPAGNLPSVPLT